MTPSTDFVSRPTAACGTRDSSIPIPHANIPHEKSAKHEGVRSQ